MSTRHSLHSDGDSFVEGQHAAHDGIPAAANPYPDGTDKHGLWKAGHELVAGQAEAGEAEDV